MRVEGISTPPSSSTVRRKTVQAGGGFSVSAPIYGEHPEKITEAQSLTALDTLVTLQEVPDARDGRKRAIKHASDMLETLEGIRLDLLNGEVPAGRLGALLRLLRQQREQVDDPRLSHLLDEIELRARVELAKLGQAC